MNYHTPVNKIVFSLVPKVIYVPTTYKVPAQHNLSITFKAI